MTRGSRIQVRERTVDDSTQIIGADAAINNEHKMEIIATEQSSILSDKYRREHRNRIRQMYDWWGVHYPSYFEQGTRILSEDEKNDPVKYHHRNNRDIIYSGLNVALVKAFLSEKKKKKVRDGKVILSSFSNLSKYNEAIKWGSLCAGQPLPSNYFHEMDAFLQCYCHEHRVAKKEGRTDINRKIGERQKVMSRAAEEAAKSLRLNRPVTDNDEPVASRKRPRPSPSGDDAPPLPSWAEPPPLAAAPPRRYYAVRFGYAARPPVPLRSAVFLRWEDARKFVCGDEALPSLGPVEYAAFESMEEAEAYLREGPREGGGGGSGGSHASPAAGGGNSSVEDGRKAKIRNLRALAPNKSPADQIRDAYTRGRRSGSVFKDNHTWTPSATSTSGTNADGDQPKSVKGKSNSESAVASLIGAGENQESAQGKEGACPEGERQDGISSHVSHADSTKEVTDLFPEVKRVLSDFKDRLLEAIPDGEQKKELSVKVESIFDEKIFCQSESGIVRVAGPHSFKYKGKCWCIPESFRFPIRPKRPLGWGMWLRGSVYADGKQLWKIKPYRKLSGKDLHSMELKRLHSSEWSPIFNKMTEAPGLEIPNDEADIDDAFVHRSYEIATEYLKSQFSYIFNNPKGLADSYALGTWSHKIKHSEVRKHGTEADISKLPPPTTLQLSRQNVMKTQSYSTQSSMQAEANVDVSNDDAV